MRSNLKRKILSLLLTLALTLTIMPVFTIPALAVDADYGLIFDAASGKMYLDVTGAGTVASNIAYEYTAGSGTTWTGAAGVLTLNNFSWVTPAVIPLYIVGGEVTINLAAGSVNTFTSTAAGVTSHSDGICADYSQGSDNLNITGEGTLNAISGDVSTSNYESRGIFLRGTLTVTDSTVNAVAVRGSDMIIDINIYSGTQKITNLNGQLTVAVSPYNGPVPVAVWYLSDAGELEKIPCTYDPETETVTFVIDHLSVYVIGLDTDVPPFVNPFTDVTEDDWFYDAVRYVYERGLMTGTTATMFSPDTTTTRGMIATILYRIAGEPDVGTTNPFTDVTAGEYYTNAVIWAAENGLVTGYGDSRFGPDDEITREQMATILFNYIEMIGKGPQGAWMIRLDYADVADISEWAFSAVAFLTIKNIIQGKPGRLFDPQGNATRAEAATILMRFLEID